MELHAHWETGLPLCLRAVWSLWSYGSLILSHPILGYDVKKGLQYNSSDEECSRSTSVHSRAKHVVRAELVGSALNGRSRKRKKKKKKAQLTSLISTSPISDDVSPACNITNDFEDPLPQRRIDLLRGGATSLQQVSPKLNALLEHSSAKISTDLKPTVSPNVSSDIFCTQDRVKNVNHMENESSPASGSSLKKKGQRCTKRQRRQLRWRSVRRQPLPWSRLSRSHVQRRHFCVSSMRSCVSQYHGYSIHMR